MTAGKDYFTDKAPLTTLEQLADAKAMVEKTGKKYAVYYSERLHVESAVFAGQLVQQGAIGRVVQTTGMGPHREGLAARTGSTIVAISAASCATSAATRSSSSCFIPATATPPWSPAVRNVNHPQYPAFEDFGDAMLKGENGASGYFRCDWFTPDGLSTGRWSPDAARYRRVYRDP